MANIDEALYTYLTNHAGLKNLIGTRVYPEEAPQSATLPHVVVIKISDMKDHFLSGVSPLERPIYQFSAIATTKSVAKSVAVQLKSALSDYHGTLTGNVVQWVSLINEISTMEKSPDGTLKIYYEDLEFEIYYGG